MLDTVQDRGLVAQGSGDGTTHATTPATASRGATPPRQPSTRYSDQPMNPKTRLIGLGGTLGIVMLIAGGGLITWTTYRTPPKPAALQVFDVAPPAAPPEPVRDVRPGPPEVQKETASPVIVPPQVEPPKILLPSVTLPPVPVAKPVADPGPPAKDTTTPETKPEPPAPQISSSTPTWEGLVLRALMKVKRYPREASFRRQQGVPYIRFVMNRAGEVLSDRLERSSGVPALDNEALALPKRASPLPKPTKEVTGDTIELVVPVEFFLR